MDGHAEFPDAAVDMQAPEIYETVGLTSDQVVDELGKLFAQHEIPLGRVNKHLVLNGRDIDEWNV
jgi:hypothetical protein